MQTETEDAEQVLEDKDTVSDGVGEPDSGIQLARRAGALKNRQSSGSHEPAHPPGGTGAMPGACPGVLVHCGGKLWEDIPEEMEIHHHHSSFRPDGNRDRSWHRY